METFILPKSFNISYTYIVKKNCLEWLNQISSHKVAFHPKNESGTTQE